MSKHEKSVLASHHPASTLDPAPPQHNVMSIADSQIVEKLEEKSRNIMVQETLRQDISMDLSLKLNKNFDDIR